MEVGTNCPEEKVNPTNPSQEPRFRGLYKEEGQCQDASLGNGVILQGWRFSREILVILHSFIIRDGKGRNLSLAFPER